MIIAGKQPLPAEFAATPLHTYNDCRHQRRGAKVYRLTLLGDLGDTKTYYK